MRKRVKKVIYVFVCIIALLCTKNIISNAEIKQYGDYFIECYIVGSRVIGTGQTYGAPTGCQNNVLVTVYGSDGLALGNDSSCVNPDKVATASVSNVAGKIRKVKSLHSLVQYGQQIYPYPQQVPLYKNVP